MEFLPVAPDHDALDCRLPSRQTAPVVVASPHSGSVYPAAFLAQAAVSLAALRRAEDAFVDELFASRPRSRHALSGRTLPTVLRRRQPRAL